MKILIIEPFTEGHRAVYATRLVRGALGRGHRVVLATLDRSLLHAEYSELASEQLDDLKILGSKSDLSSYAAANTAFSELAHWNLLRQLFRESRENQAFDMVFVCYLDSALNMIALRGSPFGSTPFAGIVMKVKFHHSRMGINTPDFRFGPVKEWLFFRLLGGAHCQAVFTIDETLPEYVSRQQEAGSSKVAYTCDPAGLTNPADKITSAATRRELERGRKGVTVLVYGWLTRRKGIKYLLDAFQELLAQGIDANILLVGQQDTDVKELLSRPDLQTLQTAGDIRALDRFVSSAEEHEVFSHADIVWLAYEDFYVMSGVMVQAGMMGLPVVVSSQGLVAYMTHKYDCGAVVQLDDKNEVRDALRLLIENDELRHAMGERAARKYGRHSVDEFNRTIFTRLERYRQEK